MKALKYIGITLLGLILVYVIWAIASPKSMDISRSIEINKDPKTVFSVVKDFNYFKQWNAWSKADTAAKNEITGSGKNIGDVWSWDGEVVGRGRLVHSSFTPNEMIENKMEIISPWKATTTETWTFREKDGKTLVTWSDKGETEIPFLMRPIMPMMIAGQFEEGLKNLKNLVENMTELPDETMADAGIAVEDMGDLHYIGIADSCEVNKLSERLGAAYGQLKAFSIKNKIEMAGMPMAIYDYYDGKTTKFIAAFPVKEEVKGENNIISGKIPAGKSIVSVHLGPYENSGATHEAIDKYAKEKSMNINRAIEIYENDPTTVKPEEIRTKVIYPVQG